MSLIKKKVPCYKNICICLEFLFVCVIFVFKYKFVVAKVSKYLRISILLVVIGGVVTSLMQLLLGNFPIDIFAFPLNIVIMAVWLYLLIDLYRHREHHAVARYLLSNEATWLSIVLLVVACMAMGLQREPATTSYPFVVAIFFVLTQLTMVILRGCRNGKGIRWRFVFNHVGLWLAIGAGFWGAPDMQVLRLSVSALQPESVAYRMDGGITPLGYDVQLVDFRAEFFDNGVPSSYEADVMIDNEKVSLSVNHPYAQSFTEDIYLTAYDYNENGASCILQVVKQPTKWIMAVGIMMLIAGAVMMFVQGYNPKEL